MTVEPNQPEMEPWEQRAYADIAKAEDEINRRRYWRTIRRLIQGRPLPDHMMKDLSRYCLPEHWSWWNRLSLLITMLVGQQMTISHPASGWDEDREVLILESTSYGYGWDSVSVRYWPQHGCWDFQTDGDSYL